MTNGSYYFVLPKKMWNIHKNLTNIREKQFFLKYWNISKFYISWNVQTLIILYFK
jgi:hypothetical protein